MPLTLTTHHLKRQQGTNHVVLEKVTPYARLNNGDSAAIFLQGGKAYGAGGDEIKYEDIPPWVFERMKSMNPKVLAEVGWKEKLDIAQGQLSEDNDDDDEEGEDKTPTPGKTAGKGEWLCPECGEVVAKNYRLAHTMKHKR